MRIRFSALAIVVACAACGAHTQQAPRAHAEFTAEDAALFEDGVDLIEAPEQLEGQWQTDWDLDLGKRIGQSDAVVYGTVTAVHVDVDPEQRTTYEVVLSVEQALAGKPARSELTLVSRQGAAGYANLAEHKDRLLNHKFVAFLRYVASDRGGVAPHFHLSPPSKLVLERVDQHQTQTRPAKVRVIEHTQTP